MSGMVSARAIHVSKGSEPVTRSELKRSSSSSAMPKIRETLREMCRPFAAIRHWSVESTNDGLHTCLVQLDEPDKHGLAAEALGIHFDGNDLCLRIRVR